jgi:hypothetical protein
MANKLTQLAIVVINMATKQGSDERRRNRIEREITEQAVGDARQISSAEPIDNSKVATVDEQVIVDQKQTKKDLDLNSNALGSKGKDNIASNTKKTDGTLDLDLLSLRKNVNFTELLNISNGMSKVNNLVGQTKEPKQKPTFIEIEEENNDIIATEEKIDTLKEEEEEQEDSFPQISNIVSQSLDLPKVFDTAPLTDTQDAPLTSEITESDNSDLVSAVPAEEAQEGADLDNSSEFYSEESESEYTEYSSYNNEESVPDYYEPAAAPYAIAPEQNITPAQDVDQDTIVPEQAVVQDEIAPKQAVVQNAVVSQPVASAQIGTPPASQIQVEVNTPSIEVVQPAPVNRSGPPAPPSAPMQRGGPGGPPPPPPGGLKPPAGSKPKTEAEIKAETIKQRAKDISNLKAKAEKSKDNIKKLFDEIKLMTDFLQTNISITAKANMAKNIIAKAAESMGETVELATLSGKVNSQSKLEQGDAASIMIEEIAELLVEAMLTQKKIKAIETAAKSDIEKAIAIHEQVLAVEKIIAIQDEVKKISEATERFSKELETMAKSRDKLFEAINTGAKYNDGTGDIVLTPSKSTTLLNKIKNSIKEKGELIYQNKIEVVKKLKEVGTVSAKYKGNTKIEAIEKEIKLLDDKIQKNLEDAKVNFSENDTKDLGKLSKELASLEKGAKPAVVQVTPQAGPPPAPGAPKPPPGAPKPAPGAPKPAPGALVKKTAPKTSITEAKRKQLEKNPEIISLKAKYTNKLDTLKNALVEPVKKVSKTVDYNFTDESLKQLKAKDPDIATKIKNDQLEIDKLSKAIKPLKELVASAKTDLVIENHKLDYIKFKKEGTEAIELSEVRIKVLEEFIKKAGPDLNDAISTSSGAGSVIGKFAQGVALSEKAMSTALKEIDGKTKPILIKMSDIISKIKAGNMVSNKDLAELSQELNGEFLKLSNSMAEAKDLIDSLKQDKAEAIAKADKDPTLTTSEAKAQKKQEEEIKFNEKIEIAQFGFDRYKKSLNELSTQKADLVKGLTISRIMDIIDHPENYLVEKKIQEIKVEIDQLALSCKRNLDELGKTKIGFDKCFTRYHDKVKKVISEAEVKNYTEQKNKYTQNLNTFYNKLDNNVQELLKIQSELSKQSGQDSVLAQINILLLIGEEVKDQKNIIEKAFPDTYIPKYTKELEDLYKVVVPKSVTTKKFVAKSGGGSGAIDPNAIKEAMNNTPQAIAARKQKAIDDLKEAKLATIAKFILEDAIAHDLGIDLSTHDYSAIEQATSLEELKLLGGIIEEA